MKVLKSTASQYLITLREYFQYTQKAKTPKTLSKELSIPQEFIEKYLTALTNTDYFKLDLSATGRLKRAWFNKFSTRIFYKDYSGAIEKGIITIGRPRSPFYQLDTYEKRDLQNFEDKARAAGFPYVNSSLSNELFVDIFIKEMQLELEDMPEQEGSIDEFAAYPLVKAEIQKYTEKLARLEKEVADEIALNERNAKWYKEECYKASIGQRRKKEAYSVVVGQERIVGVEYNRYWFDDEPTMEYTEKFVPKYETRYRSVVDHPEKPKEYYEKQNKNKYEIISCKAHLRNLSDHRIKHEKALVQEKQKKEEIAKLEKEKQELERKIRSLR